MSRTCCLKCGDVIQLLLRCQVHLAWCWAQAHHSHHWREVAHCDHHWRELHTGYVADPGSQQSQDDIAVLRLIPDKI